MTSNLGKIDAICGYATLAVDLLSEELQQNNDPREWLSGTAKLHGMILHDVDESLLSHRLAQMFVVTVHAQLEDFLNAYLTEHSASSEWPKKKDGESLFHRVLSNLQLIFRKDCEKDRETCEYYRLIRNRFSHIEENDQRLKNQRSKLRALMNIDSEHLPPKEYDQLDYGDFDLFTRAVKSIAARICSESRPPDATLVEIAKSGPFRELKRYQKNPTRYRNALRQKLLMEFGLDESESASIVESVVSGR
ncbi:hypothetical protein JIN84_01070 [Luteolibacter yonseiensis]|uniref:Uncharacterized protein n=1 Tax=Luteolibacter yonseiensis TaxID=1144680 RepID=A0A934QZY9_9BACT|nr:hypothetical protein [Luteolibacter yonseiensis]MBK1814199.1 hypothetical protein [Luteolibacter yonseiensis]